MPGPRRTPRGCRAGNVHKLNTVSKAYRTPVAQAAIAYSGANGTHARVTFARLISTKPMIHDGIVDDAGVTHGDRVEDVLNPLPSLNHPLVKPR